MSTVRNLPIGIQTFEDIRNGNYMYVDKTDLVWQVANTGKAYFLSRPRRFGKSLLISTLESYFLGRKDLFEGLALADLETEWKQYPVLHLDLNAEKFDSAERLIGLINAFLTQWEELYGSKENETTLATRFAGIIRRASEQTGMQVVVLIDEYDKPLLQNLLNEPLLEEYRNILKGFYGVLKSADRYLRFVFLTGVTKFSHVSIFSDLNQLSDISMVPAYATICGITEEELVKVFTPELKKVSEFNGYTFEETVEKMAAQYDGYHFRENTPGLFNPFSVLSALKYLVLDNFWFQTGTPTFLVDLLRESDYDLRILIDGVETSPQAFTEYRVEANNPIPVLYQSGYLTIKSYDREFGMYTLCFPNEEVKYAFLQFLVPFYTQVNTNEQAFHISHFVRELRSGDVPSFLKRLKAFFADIPYELNDETERHYQVIFYLVFKLMGQFVQAEVHSATGRADAVVYTKDQIYVFEFKLNGTAEEALQQIDDKGYLIPYIADERKLVKVGVEFEKDERNIGKYLIGI
ncbi:ATP-binding protein [Bacteroides sp. 224]|uniref:ATP-binding protein n=1 Tax=Bacteroides sp. 224 TaxID=2302936 RepID=UPI0013D31F7F|nr:ATP-binding protein [Bacteroides sp. 224]NDV65728.1 AAA family ATPase [Bacteroides sp. 224]